MIKYPKLASMILFVATAYIQIDQLIKIKKPDMNKAIKIFLSEMISKKEFHLEKKVVVKINITAVQMHLCDTSSTCPIKETYSKYITPIKPHQNDPNEVNNKPLLKFCFINK